MSKSVYLCGSITDDPKCIEWRNGAHQLMQPWGIEVLDPCRGKESDEWTSDGFEGPGTVYDRGAFVARDKRDVTHADALLLCWWGEPGRQSIGTWMEAGWATAWNKPLVFVDISGDGYLIKHPFIYKQCAADFTDLQTACKYIRWLLLGGQG